MLDSLPKEVSFEILSRLPLKAIIRSRCVSKTWCSLISGPDFVITHLNRSLSNPEHSPYLLHLCNNRLEKRRLGLDSSDAPFSSKNFTKLPSSHQDSDHFNIVAGSSNGVLCLAKSFAGSNCGSYVLWNPSIQKAVTLPNPDVGRTSHNHYITSLGFGYVPKTDDYKLVRFEFHISDPIDLESGIPRWVQIYSLRTNAWLTVSDHGPPYYMKQSISVTFLHGALHWPAYSRQHRAEKLYVIMSFDLADEAFREVGMPKSLHKKTYDCGVVVLDGLIALVDNPYRWPDPITVWMMKEYGVVESWTKLFDIKMRSDNMFSFDRVIGFRGNGELLLKIHGQLISYEPSSQRIVLLPFHGRPQSHFLHKYVESLVLLNVPNTGLPPPT